LFTPLDFLSFGSGSSISHENEMPRWRMSFKIVAREWVERLVLYMRVCWMHNDWLCRRRGSIFVNEYDGSLNWLIVDSNDYTLVANLCFSCVVRLFMLNVKIGFSLTVHTCELRFDDTALLVHALSSII
jgi:hypothetical protein